MLMQRLYELRQRLDGEIPAAHHKRVSIKWFLQISDTGEFVGWSPAGSGSTGLEEPAPYSKRSGRKPPPYLLVDKHIYVLGVPLGKEKTTPEKAAERHEMYVELVEELLASLPPEDPLVDPLDALSSFLGSPEELASAVEAAPASLSPGDLIAPQVGGIVLHREPSAMRFWVRRCDAEEEAKSTIEAECLITGAVGPIAATHAIELPMGAERTSLVSANESAYLSYGLKQSAIAPVSVEAARSYAEALRWLLLEERHHMRVGGLTYVYWCREEEPEEFDWGLTLHSPSPESVGALLRSPWSGPSSGVDEQLFYAVALTSYTSRLVVRDVIEETVGSVKAHLAAWFERQQLRDVVTGEITRPCGLFPLAASLVQDINRQLPPQVIPWLVRAATKGEPLPAEILSMALLRIRADTDHRMTRPRASLLKMALNDYYQVHRGAKEDTVTTDVMTDDSHLQGEDRVAYRCGRLFAELENLQREALGKGINATIADRFFGTASSAPATVFGNLMVKRQAHLQKLRKGEGGAYRAIDTRIEEIVSGIPNFPMTLSLEQQGLFAIGYYHQRAEASRQRAERAQAKQEHADG